MFSSSVNHLVQKRRDTKYVLSAMLYTANSTPQNPFGKSPAFGRFDFIGISLSKLEFP